MVVVLCQLVRQESVQFAAAVMRGVAVRVRGARFQVVTY